MASTEGGDTIADAGSAARERTRLRPVGFWSYSRQDDELSFGKLSNLRKLLMAEVQQLYGKERVQIFQDAAAIVHGAEWEREIRTSLTDATFFIPIITPNFIQSEWCSREVSIFLEREQDIYRDHPDLPRRGRILPILLIDVTGVEPHDPAVLAALEARQWFDYSRYRLRSLQDEQVQQALSEFAASIRDLLNLKASPQPSAEERERAASAQAAAAARAEDEERKRKQAEAAAEKRRRAAEKRERDRLAAEAAAARLAAEQAEALEREQAERTAEVVYDPPPEEHRPRRIWPWVLIPVGALGAVAAAGIVLLAQPDSAYYADVVPPPVATSPENLVEPVIDPAPVERCQTLWAEAGSAADPAPALRSFIAACPNDPNLAEARLRLEDVTAPIVAPRRTDGRWSIAWSTNGTDYSGTMVANADEATILLEFMAEGELKRVRQSCVIEGEDMVSIRCSEAEVLSGPGGYSADSFSLRFSDSTTMQGTGVDDQDVQMMGVILRRL